MARACATKRSLSSWTSYKKGLVDSGKSCGVLVVSPLIALMHAYAGTAGVFTQTSSVKPNPFANVTIKIDVIFTFKLNACANSVYQAFPPRFEGLGTRLGRRGDKRRRQRENGGGDRRERERRIRWESIKLRDRWGIQMGYLTVQ